jgi:hypothetical protein
MIYNILFPKDSNKPPNHNLHLNVSCLIWMFFLKKLFVLYEILITLEFQVLTWFFLNLLNM